MAKYKVINPNNEKLEELARISHNLRYYSKIWKEHYGAENRRLMQGWEKAMDEFLQENVDYTDVGHLEANYNQVKGNWAYDTAFER